MTTTTNTTDADLIANAVAAGKVTKVPTGAATTKRGKVAARKSGATKRKPRGATTTAPAGVGKDANKRSAQRGLKKSAPSTPVKTGNTFTTVDLAKEHNVDAKTLRARIRRNIDRWSPLFKDGAKHVFADNAATRKAVAALLNA